MADVQSLQAGDSRSSGAWLCKANPKACFEADLLHPRLMLGGLIIVGLTQLCFPLLTSCVSKW